MINEKKQLEFARDLIQDLVRLAVSHPDSRGGADGKGARRAAVRSGQEIADHLAGEWVGEKA